MVGVSFLVTKCSFIMKQNFMKASSYIFAKIMIQPSSRGMTKDILLLALLFFAKHFWSVAWTFILNKTIHFETWSELTNFWILKENLKSSHFVQGITTMNLFSSRVFLDVFFKVMFCILSCTGPVFQFFLCNVSNSHAISKKNRA